MKKSTLSLLVVVAIFTVVFPRTNLFAAPGNLDPAFGSAGIVGLPFPCLSSSPGWHSHFNVSLALTPVPDNKIVVGGTAICLSPNITVARKNADGSPDTTFGDDGIVDSDALAREYGGVFHFVRTSNVAVQPDGKIIVGGDFAVGAYDPLDISFSGIKPYLTRFNSDGSLDSGFGEGGLVVPSETLGFVNSVALQPEGKIIVCGSTSDKHRSIIVRFNSNGSLDTSFGGAGSGGQVSAACPYLSKLAIQRDGKIIARSSDTSDRLILIRLSPDGTLDTSFHTDTSVIPLNSNAARGIVLQGEKVIISDYGAISRLNPDGSLDTSFGSSGSVSDSVLALMPFHGIRYVAVTKRNKIVVVTSSAGDFGPFMVVRLTADGSLDTSFNTTGYVTTEIPISGRRAVAVYNSEVLIQNDDKIVIGGVSIVNRDLGIQESFATLVRYEGDPTLSYHPPTAQVPPLSTLELNPAQRSQLKQSQSPWLYFKLPPLKP